MLQETIENGVDLETARWQARVDLAAAHRLCRDARLQRGHLQPPDLPRARRERPLLPDPVRPALVRGDGKLLHGSRL